MTDSAHFIRSPLPPGRVFGAFAVGVFLSVAIFLVVRAWEERVLEARAAEVTHEHLEKLQVSMLRSMEVLHSIVALHSSERGLNRLLFRGFVREALARQPELQALSWNPVVRGARRAEFEMFARSSGLASYEIRQNAPSGGLVRAQDRPEFVPVLFIEPEGGNTQALGYDLNSDPLRRGSLVKARTGGQPVATAPIQLAQGPGNDAGVLVMMPAYRRDRLPPAEQPDQEVEGFAVAVFRVSRLVGGVLGDLRKKGVDLELRVGSPKGEVIYGDIPRHQPEGTARIQLADADWVALFARNGTFSSGTTRFQSWVVLGLGLAFTAVTTGFLWLGWRQEEKVALANRALQAEVGVRQKAEETAALANQAKSDFLASMSHEIRTPLNAILGYTQLMQRDRALPPEQKDLIQGIAGSGRHLLGLLNEILDLSKIEAGRMELKVGDFDLAAFAHGIEAVFRPLCAQKKIAFRVSYPKDASLRVSGDEGKLRQVLINLLGNAVKFTTAGEVCFAFRNLRDREWMFEVVDTGLGIPEEERADIFKPFHQGRGACHQGGTGLGLAIALRQVELLGGSLELDSERGSGSRFHFTIPLAAPQTDPTTPGPGVVRLAPGHAVRALVVDDHRDNREVFRALLRSVGCEVTVAVDGPSVVRKVASGDVDIVFLDLLMPGTEVFELAKQIQASAPRRIPIIAHTASPLSQLRNNAMGVGCADFLSKPFEAERLFQILQEQLGVVFITGNLEREESSPFTASDLARVSLPEPVCARLLDAAELHSTTALKACLRDLRTHGIEANRLADEIRQLMRSYDMIAIQALVTQVSAQAQTSRRATDLHGEIVP